MMRGGESVCVDGERMSCGWGKTVVRVSVAAMDGGRGRGGRDGGYILFCDAMVFGGGREDGI